MDETSTACHNVSLAEGVVIGKGNMTGGRGDSLLRGELGDGAGDAVMGLCASVGGVGGAGK